MTEPGDTTPISDEAGEYVIDHGWLCEVHNEHTCGVAKNDPVHEPGCGLEPIARVEELLRALSAAPLLVSAEAERRGDSDELLAAAAHESSEDRRLAALMVEPRNRAVLERRAEVTERLAAEVEGLRAELAAALAALTETDDQISAAFDVLRGMADEVNVLPVIHALESSHAPAALRAVDGQEKPNGGRADEDGVVFMPAGEAVETGTEWRVFAGGPDPDDCAMSRPADGEIEAEEEADWIIGGQVACRKVDYGPWQIVPPAAPVGGQAEPSDAQIDADLALDGFDPKDRYPEHGHDALRTAYRSGWESAGIAAAAVSGEHR